MIIKRILPLRILSAVLLAILQSVATARTARAIFLGATADSPTEATLVFGESHVTTPLPRSSLSAEFKLPGESLSAFVLSEKPPRTDAEIDPYAPSVSFPEDSNRFFLLFLQDPTNEVFPVRVVVVDASVSEFPFGYTTIFNFSDMHIDGQFGDEKVLIQPGGNELIQPPRSDSGSYPVNVSCALANDSENWIPLVSSTWRYNANVRKLMFVMPHPRRKYPFLWSVDDHPQL